jgi:sugar lactone lactonase YvrE
VKTLSLLFLSGLASTLALGAPPRDALPVDAGAWPRNYRLHLEFPGQEGGVVKLGGGVRVTLTGGGAHDLAVEHPPRSAPVLRVWSGGVLARGPEELPGLNPGAAQDFPSAAVRLEGAWTAMVRFTTTGNGTLVAKCPPTGNWAPDSKALFLRDGHLVYDVGWLGALGGGPRVDDGQPHTAVLQQEGSAVKLWLDGQLISEKSGFARPDGTGHVLKVGRASPNFAGDLQDGRLEQVRIWQRTLNGADLAQVWRGNDPTGAPAEFQHTSEAGSGRPVIVPAAPGVEPVAWVQALERSDHGELVRGWNDATLAEGRRIYSSLCVVCHGTRQQPGSLPTALRFAEGAFKNGSDPYSLYVTLTRGYGQMVPQHQFTTAQKYAVIQYVRETFLRPYNPSQYVAVTPEYLAGLPKGLARTQVEQEDRSLPEYRRMDFGPVLFWTYEVAPGNFAQKGLAVRLDEGTGGVSRGRAWMVYDHDTLRVATATTGEFVDWKGIAFDGSHGTHTRLTGERHWVNPPGPGWASPEGSWKDPRPLGRDGLPYGPLPRTWARYLGTYLHPEGIVFAQEVGGLRVWESPGWIDYGTAPVFIRTLNVAPGKGSVLTRVAPENLQVILRGEGRLRREDGFWVAELPAGARTRLFISRTEIGSLGALAKGVEGKLDLEPLTRGGGRRWQSEVTTTSRVGADQGAFQTDDFPLPERNPWESWMRPGGFDFTPDGKAAVVATWNGDVWRVDGVMDPSPANLRWRRMATGLFQPLGVKFRGDELFITCRDQLVRLQDLNGDGESDYLESFNNDHQVTEHFHEFAMGLQTDDAGNFYYAKSGRHALKAVVPHHGTLLKVSADGTRTEILATGFRAANGVALDADGTFWVTDQEGFWTPKNRINRVKPGGFYGNLFGYTDVTDTSDAAMEPPLVWITNAKDRSPAELVRVPKGVWGSLGGSLLNLSYGTGRAFAVTTEQVDGVWQGAVCELPMPAFGTGIMRGRFGSDGALYTCGLFAWAGNATTPGGFHRIRRLPGAAHVPLQVRAAQGVLRVTFSEGLDPGSVTPSAFAFRVWNLKRSANYGSAHHDEHPVEIARAALELDGRTVVLHLPSLAPTQCYELKVNLKSVGGGSIERVIHGTLHRLAPR